MKDSVEGLFEKFLKASTFIATLQTFRSLCDELSVEYPPARTTSNDHITFYAKLKAALGTYWKAQSLFAKLDKKYNDDENFTGRKNSREGRERVAKDMNVLIIGAGPCGLRTAIFTALLGAKTMIVEKRESFSRNNVLHLWPFTIEDLKALGAKKFNGRFCSGAIDHVSIRQLQLILTKAALIFGVEIHVNNSFVDLVPPNIEGTTAWKAKIDPESSPVNDFEFNLIVGADGRKNTLQGFKKKEFRGSLAIGITVNFINKHTSAEAQVSEISGINFIYRQDFFRSLNMEHNIDLENIVYYKDDTHYFVMTARKQSLLQRGVLRENLDDPKLLVHGENIDQKALLEYALDAVNFCTENKLPDLEVAINNYGLPDIALFDFTCMKSAVNASMFQEVNGVRLLKALVGDGLLEPFWPKGTGIAKGFLAAYDTAWLLRQWALMGPQDKANDKSLELGLLAERESLYRILPQVESNSLVQNYMSYTVDPKSRYQRVPPKLKLGLVRSFYVTDGKEIDVPPLPENLDTDIVPRKLTRNVSFVRSNKLQQWCEKVLRESGSSVLVTNMSSSWKSGCALCAIISYFRPDILDLDVLQPDNDEFNNQLAFDAAEKHLGITPIMSGKEMAESEDVDDLVMITYLSQFYEVLKNETPVKPVKRVSDIVATPPEDSLPKSHSKKKSPLGLLARFSQQFKRKSVQRGSSKEYEIESSDTKRRKTFGKKESDVAQSESDEVVLTKATLPTIPDEDKENTVLRRRNSVTPGVRKSATNRISALGMQLISQFEQNSDQPSPKLPRQPTAKSSSNECYFCGQTVYIVERLSVEGLFFHRECFKCCHCETILRPMSYKRDCDTGKFYCTVHYFANAEYLKKKINETPETSQPEKPTLPEIEIVETDACDSISDHDRSSLRSPVSEEHNLSLHTIEHGQVVIKRDATPRRSDMEQMALFLSNQPIEIGEQELNEHNMRCSHNSDSEDDELSGSEEEELDQLANKITGLNERSAQNILSEYHRELSITKTSDSAFLSSSSDGDDDISSLSSTSSDGAPVKQDVPDEMDDLVQLLSDSKEKQQAPDDNISLSSASTEEDPNVDVVIKADVSEGYCEAVIESVDENNQEPSIAIQRKDTLESAERHILENPIIQTHSKSAGSSCQEIDFEEQNDLVKLLHKGNEEKTVRIIRSRTLSSSSSEGKEDDGVVEGDELRQDEAMSSESSDGSTATIDANEAASPGKSKSDTSIWATNSTEAVGGGDHLQFDGDKVSLQEMECDFSSPKELETLKHEEDSVGRNREMIASTPKFAPFTPVDSDIFMTPCSDRRDPEESFHTVKSDQSWIQDISSYVSPSFLDSSNTTATDSNVSDTPKPSPSEAEPQLRRRLPETPKSSGRRRLPVIPHLEALSPTTSEVSPRQRKRIEMKLKKHEDRVMERIRKMKLGMDSNTNGENSLERVTEDSKADERADFVDKVPFLLQRRNNALLRKKKHKHGKSSGENKKPGLFQFGNKKKLRKEKEPVMTSPPRVMSPNNRASRKRDLASYSREELDSRVSQRVRLAEERQAKEAERKRMARALVIQGQLQEVDSKQKQLEKRGVELEKLLRDQKSQGVRPRDSSLHMHEWFKLVQEKNALLRYENELMIYQRELQLEDRQSRLQLAYRKLIAMDDSKKSPPELKKEKEILNEMMEVVEQRDQLVALLDEQKVHDSEENSDIQQVLINKFGDGSSQLTPL